MPLAPQHRADVLVSASRIFSAALRTAKALHMAPARCTQSALSCARRHTGVDWRDELDFTDVVDPSLPLLADPEDDPDSLYTRVVDYLAGVDQFDMRGIIAALELGDPRSLSLAKRIGNIARQQGWRPHRQYPRDGGVWQTLWRPRAR